MLRYYNLASVALFVLLAASGLLMADDDYQTKSGPRDFLREDVQYRPANPCPKCKLLSNQPPARKHSQEQVPHEMFDYLKPGMYVGMERLNGTASVALNVYSDGQDGNLVVARSLKGAGPKGVNADEFAKDHPAVRNQLAELKRQPAAEKLQLRIRGARDITLGRITGIGVDHLLIELDERSKLRLLPKAAIGHIDLDADPATFIFAPKDTTD